MKNNFFLPQWYLESKRDKNKRVMRLSITVAIIINIFLVNLLIVKVNKIKILETKISEKSLYKKEDFLDEDEGNRKNYRTLSTLQQINKTMKSDIPFEGIYITDEKANIQVSGEGFDYISFIKHIEQEDKLTIKNLILPEEQNNNKFNIYVELK